MRGATRRAVAEIADAMHDLGAAEEEHLTATLLAGLAGEITALPVRTRLVGGAGPHLRVGHRTVTKKEERANGADIGVVVDVRLPGRLHLRTGDPHLGQEVRRADARVRRTRGLLDGQAPPTARPGAQIELRVLADPRER